MFKIFFNYLFILLIMISCATNKRSIYNDVKDGNISATSVMDLARTSYLKGCTESRKFEPAENQYFEWCVERSKEHAHEIFEIITQEVKHKPSN